MLRDLAANDEFTAEEKAALDTEIKDHVSMTTKFQKKHTKYTQGLAHGVEQGKFDPKTYQEKHKLARKRMIGHQNKVRKTEKGIREKIRARLGDEL